MKVFRQVCAVPFFAVGVAFGVLAALILGDQHVDWLDVPNDNATEITPSESLKAARPQPG